MWRSYNRKTVEYLPVTIGLIIIGSYTINLFLSCYISITVYIAIICEYAVLLYLFWKFQLRFTVVGVKLFTAYTATHHTNKCHVRISNTAISSQIFMDVLMGITHVTRILYFSRTLYFIGQRHIFSSQKIYPRF